MADDIRRYQIDGSLYDANGNGVNADGSFDVDYTANSISNINLTVGSQTFNTAGISSSAANDGSTEYSVNF